MQNIFDILKANGIEVTDEQKTAISKAVAENYKTIAEHDKKVGKLETERDNLQSQLDTANDTLKGFEGVDAEGMQKKIDDYKKQIENLEKTHKQEIYDRDFSDALTAAMEQYKFTSEYAKKSVMAEIKEAGLKLVDGKIIGLNDMVETIKGKDATAFVDEEQEELESHKATFTKPLNNKKKGGKMSMAELMKLKNENPDMDISQYLGKGE